MSDHSTRRRWFGITHGETPTTPTTQTADAYAAATNHQLAELNSRLEDVNGRIGEMSHNFLASDTLRETAKEERQMRVDLELAIRDALAAAGQRNPVRPILEDAMDVLNVRLHGKPDSDAA